MTLKMKIGLIIIISVIIVIAVIAIRFLIRIFHSAKINIKSDILRYGKFYISTNQITLQELEDLLDLYYAFKRMHNDQYVENVVEKCRKLPIVTKRTEWNPYYVGTDGYIK